MLFNIVANHNILDADSSKLLQKSDYEKNSSNDSRWLKVQKLSGFTEYKFKIIFHIYYKLSKW